MEEIRIFKKDEQLDEAYNLLVEKINGVCNQFQLNYYELFGILECIKVDLYRDNLDAMREEE